MSSRSLAMQATSKAMSRYIQMNQMNVELQKMRDKLRAEMVSTRLRDLEIMIKRAQELDLAFLVDVTGSMQKYIDVVKEKISDIAAGVMKAYPQLKLRVAFAPYRDYGESSLDDADACDFTESFSGRGSIFIETLARVRAGGGNDVAEDIFSGLERVAKMSWKSSTRVLVHIADAPCHGLQFHDGVEDYYPEGDKKGRYIGNLLKVLRDDRQIASYLFCHINNSTMKMMQEFKKHAGQCKWILEEQLSNVKNLVHIVVTASCGSISQCMVMEGRPVAKYIPQPVDTLEPRWDTIKAVPAVQIKYKWPGNLESLFKILATNGELELEQMEPSTVQIARFPFSDEGNLRWPFYAMVHQPTNPPRSMVVKRFKTPLGECTKKLQAVEAYLEQMEVQTVAARLAMAFNQELQNLHAVSYKTVQFTLVSVLKVGSNYFNMEKVLKGEWIRYSNNANYVNTQEYAATLHAFTHWTHERSKGLLMVTDLQGVQIGSSPTSKVFWLCDPAVHCTDVLRYQKTRTNWGEHGFKLFFDTHKCNNICRGLRLKPTKNGFTTEGTQLK